ncbi:MAG: hypothetical protein AAF467_19525 [Actinomycetota bacterium]
MTRRVLALLSVLALLAAACGPEATETAGEATNDAADKVDARDADADAEAEADDGTEALADMPAEVQNADLVGLSGTLVDNEFPPEVDQCMGAELLKQPSVALDLVTAGSNPQLDALSLDTQLAVFEILGDCAGPELLGEFFAAEFARGADMVETSDELGACFGQAATDDDGPYMMVGLATIGDDMAPRPEAQPATIDALTECVNGSVIADSLLENMTSDPTFAAAADLDCISSSYENADLRPLWTAFVTNPNADFDTLPADVTAPIVSPIFDCVSIGQVMAAEAAASGVTLSNETIACIDDAARSTGLMDSFLLGTEPDADEFGAIVLDCLSPEELSQVGG